MSDETTTGINSRKLLMWVFLGSDCMFFASLIGTYLIYKGTGNLDIGPVDVFDIPTTSVSTFVLLMSSMSMVFAYAYLVRNNIKAFRIWMVSTIIMGATFLGFQVFEFSEFYFHYNLSPQTNLFGTTFYALTGTHGLHVTVGVVWLAIIFYSSLFRNSVSAETNLDLDLAALYWHFVDIVWIVIFAVVYLFGTFPGFPS
tara:strand:- start:2033 stop:2629 length:597 start_codon:yes stop_codon:yes gene_type:complete